MKALAGPYNLKLECAAVSGSYLPNVNISVEKPDGTAVVSKDGTGPWVYIDLAPGTYRIKAWHNDVLRTHVVDVTGEQKTVILHWQ